MKSTKKYVVYKATLEKLAEEKRTSISELSSNIGHTHAYLSGRFSYYGGQYALLPRPVVAGLALALGVTMSNISEEPNREKKEGTQGEIAMTQCGEYELLKILEEGFRMTHKQMEQCDQRTTREIIQAINAAANMLHNDLRALLAEWKPRQPKEPKYAIKEREQP